MLKKVSKATSARLKGGGRRFVWMLGLPVMFVGQIALAEPVALDVTVTGDGVVTSEPSGIDCGGGMTACSATMDLGTMVTLTATPGSDMAVQWTSGCAATSAEPNMCALTLDAAASVAVAFEVMEGNGDEETAQEEAARRMPPVLYGLTLPQGGLVPGAEATIEWSLLGYHGGYQSAVAMFDCTGVEMGECGKYYKDHVASSGKIGHTEVLDTTWVYGTDNVPGKEFTFSHTFTIPEVTDSTKMVLRFYRINSEDETAGSQSISLLVPGGIPNVEYYDTSGRRISVMVEPVTP